MINLNNKTAFITGGGSGIGRGIAKIFAECGASVVIAGRRVEMLEETRYMIEKAGGCCDILVGDIRKDGAMEEFFVSRKKNPVEILVNNAGVLGRQPENFMTMPHDDFNEIIDTNLWGAYKTTGEFIKHLFTVDRGGSIVNIGSICGNCKNSNYIAYAASKSALIGFSSAIAARYGHYKIRSNVIIPGFITTDMTYAENPDFDLVRAELEQQHPLGRLGTPDDVARAAAFLASDWSGFITGTTLLVDGGLTVSDNRT